MEDASRFAVNAVMAYLDYCETDAASPEEREQARRYREAMDDLRKSLES